MPKEVNGKGALRKEQDGTVQHLNGAAESDNAVIMFAFKMLFFIEQMFRLIYFHPVCVCKSKRACKKWKHTLDSEYLLQDFFISKLTLCTNTFIK